MLNIKEIEFLPLPKDQYEDEAAPKHQIVLHHTASGDGSQGDLQSWRSTREKIATAFVIERSGKLVQVFHSSRWAYHLGISSPRWPQQDRQSIGIELDSWGALNERDGKFFSWSGKEIPGSQVHVYPKPWRGFRAFERYTPEQLQKLEDLLVYLGDLYKIPLGFGPEIFEYQSRALELVPGVYAHASYRKDKADAHPQPELIAIGQRLKLRA